MIEQLFGSKTRVKLLQLFYSNPNRSFYVREITRKIDEQINSVRRELSNLLSIGIISSDNNNNRLYYEVNQSYEYFQPLSMIFGSGVRDVSKGSIKDPAEEVKSLGNVELALYTGYFTRDENSGIDMLIVGDVNQTKVAKFIADIEREEGRELRFTIMTPKEFVYRQQVNDRFLAVVLGSKIQVVVDKKETILPKPRLTKATKVSEKKKE